MNWKEFLKPTTFKIIIFVILFSVTSVFGSVFYNNILGFSFCTAGPHGECVRALGFPIAATISDIKPFLNFSNVFAVTVNIVLWYFISALISWWWVKK